MHTGEFCQWQCAGRLEVASLIPDQHRLLPTLCIDRCGGRRPKTGAVRPSAPCSRDESQSHRPLREARDQRRGPEISAPQPRPEAPPLRRSQRISKGRRRGKTRPHDGQALRVCLRRAFGRAHRPSGTEERRLGAVRGRRRRRPRTGSAPSTRAPRGLLII